MKRALLLAIPVLLATVSGCAVVGAATAVGSAAVAVGSAAVYVGAKTVEVAADATVGTAKIIGKAVSSDDADAGAKDGKDGKD